MKKMLILLACSFMMFACTSVEDVALKKLDEIGAVIRADDMETLKSELKDFAEWQSGLNYEDTRKVDDVIDYWVEANPAEGFVLGLYLLSEFSENLENYIE